MSYETQWIVLEVAFYVVIVLIGLTLLDLALMLIDAYTQRPKCHQTEACNCPVEDCAICGEGGK